MNQRRTTTVIFVCFFALMIGRTLAASDSVECRQLLERGAASFTNGPPAPNAYRAALKSWSTAWQVCQRDGVPLDLRVRSAARWSDVLIDRGDLISAESAYAEMIQLVQKKEGPDSPVLVTLLRGMADVQGRSDNLEAALHTQQNLLELTKRVFGAVSVESARSLLTIGYTFKGMGNLVLAEEYFREGIGVAKKACGDRCALLAGGYGALYDVLKTQPGREAEALKVRDARDEAVPLQ